MPEKIQEIKESHPRTYEKEQKKINNVEVCDN
jgi:hypothetical protein